MDVDESENAILQSFRCMNTNDRDVLVTQFQQMITPDHSLSRDGARFFLDMNNWNLQEALGAFYDYGAPGDIPLPNMEFVKDVTIGEGESVPPNTEFTKVWKVRNSGSYAWPSDCSLRKMAGNISTWMQDIPVPSIGSGEEIELSTKMLSPSQAGTYESLWRMVTAQGEPFGEHIWCILSVEECGVLGITQKIASTQFGNDFTAVPRLGNTWNMVSDPSGPGTAAAAAGFAYATSTPFSSPVRRGYQMDGHSSVSAEHISPCGSPASVASSLLNDSTSAQLGSPINSPRRLDSILNSIEDGTAVAPTSSSGQDQDHCSYDPPESPNGSCALHRQVYRLSPAPPSPVNLSTTEEMQ